MANPDISKLLKTSLILLLIAIIIVAIETYLVMVIWNDVIIKKFPSASIQELSFWDALSIMVLFSILCPTTIVYANKSFSGNLI